MRRTDAGCDGRCSHLIRCIKDNDSHRDTRKFTGDSNPVRALTGGRLAVTGAASLIPPTFDPCSFGLCKPRGRPSPEASFAPYSRPLYGSQAHLDSTYGTEEALFPNPLRKLTDGRKQATVSHQNMGQKETSSHLARAWQTNEYHHDTREIILSDGALQRSLRHGACRSLAVHFLML
jgi:hypothetical protein